MLHQLGYLPDCFSVHSPILVVQLPQLMPVFLIAYSNIMEDGDQKERRMDMLKIHWIRDWKTSPNM